MTSKDPAPKWQSFPKYLAEISDPRPQAESGQEPPERYLIRHITWLNFNDRVLSEAEDPATPALERLRFAAIVSSNLDEFFMVRVAEIARLARRNPAFQFPFGMTPALLLGQIREHALRQKARQAEILKQILADLKREGIHIYADFSSDGGADAEIRSHLPELKLIICRSTDPFPALMSDRIHVYVRFPGEYAVISLPERSTRLVHLSSLQQTHRFALLDRWLAARAAEFFPGRTVLEAVPFKIIRDADLRYRTEDEETLEEQIVQAVQQRVKAKVVRLEVDAPAYSEGSLFLATALGLDPSALYRFDLPLDLRTFMEIYSMKNLDRLRYPPVRPLVPRCVATAGSLFDILGKRDVLLHHPYDSFEVIVRFLRESAADPKVTHIYHTLYRTSKESPLMEALKEAVQKGKKVTVYVEIKARFDELNNVRWASELRQAGVKVVRPMSNFKVHCKLTQVLRDEEDGPASYLHLGTGNYHPGTALQYTDLGLLTRDPGLGKEVSSYLASLIHHTLPSDLKDLMVAPLNLHKQFLKLIREEVDIQKKQGGGHIIAKMNSLVDYDIIEALYEASGAGVRVDLIVRGSCCLRPGVPGLSENIRVTSVVDRFLEHSRIYYFKAGGEGKVYLSSADWMPRNFYARYEIAFPVKDALLRRFIRDVILEMSLSDNVKAWRLNPDGSYVRQRPKDADALRSQFVFEELSQKHYEGTVLGQRVPVPAPAPAGDPQPSGAA